MSDGESARASKRVSRGSGQGRLKRLKKASPANISGLAHKSSPGNAPKRRASEAANAQGSKQMGNRPGMEGDSTRRYIHGRLMIIIRSIFEEHVQREEPAVEEEITDQPKSEEKTVEKDQSSTKDTEQPIKELSDSGKAELEEKTKVFVTELESCMMDTYGEPDRTGKPHAGQKYK